MLCAVFDPVETHVDGFGAALFDGVIGDASGASVVGLDWSGRLRVAHFEQCGAEHGGVFGIVEECAKFGFGGGGHDGVDDGAVDVDGAVDGWRDGVGIWSGGCVGGEGAEEEIAAGTGAGLGFGEVGCVAVDVEDHVAGMVADGGVRMSGAVVEQLGDGARGGFGTVGLGAGEGAEGDEQSGVDGASVVEKSTDDFLKTGDAGGGEASGEVGWRGELCVFAVDGSCPGMGRVLWPDCWGFLEFQECFFDVAGHGQVDGAGCVVPFECHAEVAFAGPFGGAGVKGFEAREEMFGVFAADIFDAEVVDDETEGDGTGVVTEEAGCVFAWVVAGLGKVCDEAFMGDDAGLGEAVHAFADFDHDGAVVDEVVEFILFHDDVGNGAGWDAHVFEFGHGSV